MMTICEAVEELRELSGNPCEASCYAHAISVIYGEDYLAIYDDLMIGDKPWQHA